MNPFRYGCVVKGDYFCPRRLQESELTRLIESGQNVMIQGARRMGKTSLVQELSGKVKGIHFIYVDLLGIRTIYDFARKLTMAISKSNSHSGFLTKLMRFLYTLRPTLSLDPSGTATLSVDVRSSSSMDSLETLMDTLGKLGEEHRCCVVFDEFQDILQLEDSASILAMLRGKIQFHSGVSYVYLGSLRNKMSELFTDSRQPFYKSAVIFDIGHIDDADFVPFIRKRFQEAGRSIDDETIRELLEMADRVSGDVQELCDALWATTEEGDAITRASIPAALELVFARESKSYTPIMAQLSRMQLRMLQEIARQGGKQVMGQAFMEAANLHNAASIRKSILRLVELDILYLSDDGEYRFSNPFLREWMLRQ